MKKFLRLPFSAPEVPQALDQRILAAAALKANRTRKQRNVIRFAVPASAAAAFLTTGIVFYSYS